MSNLKIIETEIDGIFIVKTDPYVDDRGSYQRVYCENDLSTILNGKHMVNINYQSTLRKGTIRGLHFQEGRFSEAKLIRCLNGRIFDVVVDVRSNSNTFLKQFSIELSSDSNIGLFVSEGFAHGFQTLTDDCKTIYSTTQFYNPQMERGINPLDPLLKIPWPIKEAIISTKDRSQPFINGDFKGVTV